MRYGLLGSGLLALTLISSGGPAARAQAETYPVPGLPAGTRIPNPLPTGNPGGHGVYTFGEFLLLTQTWTLGDQVVAYRGLIDSRGLITGQPGTYIGSGASALSTEDFPRRSYQPGFNVGIGFKFEEGWSVYASYTHLMEQDYHTGATLVPPFFRSRQDLSDTFLVSPVYNFPPQYAGPLVKTAADVAQGTTVDTDGDGVPDTALGTAGGNFYGIWNGASVMDIQFNQWYNAAEIGARVPLFQGESSRIYGTAGARYNNFMERFKWRTVSFDIDGNATSRDAVNYSNTLSQRMYGPFVGCGHEMYLGRSFALSLDVTAAALFNVVKERAKYELGSDEIQNKLSRNEFSFVPNFTANLNVAWYPIDGVQLRLGYTAMTWFNTMNMEEPIGFNYSSIDPAYETQVFRLMHGVNFGVGLFF